MGKSVAAKLIESHLLEGDLKPGREIGLRIDQTLTQDATGTLVMLELEAMGLERVRTEVSVQYVDHNILQEDNKNQEDHLFLLSAARRFGLWFSPPGNGVSHPLHQERFGMPGKTLLGSDSHTPAGGSMGMLAIGAGGMEVAMAMAGQPFYVKMPKIWGIRLSGSLPDWVSAKDVVLEMLRRHDVKGAVGCILEYYGPGLDGLSAMDRHVIANMGAEMGATTTVFPADREILRFLRAQGREGDFAEILPDPGAAYDLHEEIDLSTLEPLIAEPSSPGKVRTVRSLEGQSVVQAYIGSSANPGYRDFAVPAEMVRGKRIAAGVSFDVNPTSRQILASLIEDGSLLALVQAGARVHQSGCNGCIGMGQAPATRGISLRTVPRNFPGRSGTLDDSVYLVSPETATAAALTGAITDPRDLGIPCPRVKEQDFPRPALSMIAPPLNLEEARAVALDKGPNIQALPGFEALPDSLEITVLLKVGPNISTDEILPAGARVLPFRSNIPRISEFTFIDVDPSYASKAAGLRDQGRGHAIVGGPNYGQGSSREHAALAPRYLGLRAVFSPLFARIHWQNLVNFGVLPLVFDLAEDYERLQPGDQLGLANVRQEVGQGSEVTVRNHTQNYTFLTHHDLSPRQVKVMLAGGLINWARQAAAR